MDPATLATTICKASAKALENLFNGSIRCLAAFGIFRSELMVAVDGTPVETTANYSGCGCQKRIKYKLSAEGKRVKVVEWVYGWRLIALVDLVTLIPLAIKIVQIQDHEAPHLLALVAQAQKNLQPYSRIVQIVIDRAYVDGSTLYQLDSSGLTFVVIAKSNMVAYTTARELAVKAKRYERVLLVTHSQGRHSWSSELVTTVTPVTGIRTWANYRPPKTPGKRRPRLRPQDRRALNAVVISSWRSQVPDGGARVLLTNGKVDNPWLSVDAYDDRSWIENGLFRNNKQFWNLTHWFPQKTEAGVRAHLTFVMMMMAVATAKPPLGQSSIDPRPRTSEFPVSFCYLSGGRLPNWGNHPRFSKSSDNFYSSG